MEKTIRQLSGELRARNHLEQNLPALMNHMADAYGMLSLHNLAMELSMFQESKAEKRIKPDKTVKEIEEILFAAMGEALFDAFDLEKNKKAVDTLTELREKVTARMDILTAYADLLTLYEYILNRLEPKLEEETKKTEPVDNDAAARWILRWIFSDEDHAMVNERIRETLFCLPVRMTRGKLTELIENAFSLYRGTDRQSLDLFDYMLRCAAGLYRPKGMAKQFPKLEKIRKTLDELRQKEPTKETYPEYRQQLAAGSDAVYQLSECYSALQAILNALLTVLLTRPHFTPGTEEKAAALLDLIRSLCMEEEADAETLFAGLEGAMEHLSEQVGLLEPLFFQAAEGMEQEISQFGLTAAHKALLMAQRLNSGSTYAALSEEEKTELPDGCLEEKKQQFTAEVRELFSSAPRLYSRAVTAAVLRVLPVYFNSHTEVMDYVRSSLEQCRDEGEKKISLELLKSYIV